MKLLKLRRAKPAVDQILTIRELVTDEVFNYVKNGGRIKDIAYHTDLAKTTIAKLAYNETKRPQLHTCVVVLEFFDYELTAIKR